MAKFDDAREIISKNGGFKYASQLAAELIDKGIDSLAQFGSEPSRETHAILTGLARYLRSRDK
jgi:geranylgeranyl pyrophosphate synthase